MKIVKHELMLILLLISSAIGYTQQRDQVVFDSLEKKSFKELKTIFYANFENKKLAEQIALFTLKKAKDKEYHNGIINSYMRLSRVTRDNQLRSLSYIDSCVYFAKKYKNENLLAEGNFYKARVLFILKKYDESLKLYISSRNHYKKNKNDYMYNVINYNIGTLKLRIQANEDALEIFRECFEHEKKVNNDSVSDSYLYNLHAYSIAHAANNNFDTVSLLNKKGYELAKKSTSFNPLKFTHIEGGNQFLKGNLRASKDSLLKVIPFLKTENDPADLAIAYYYLGRIFEEYNQPDQFILYYKKVDSIFENREYIIQTPREAYIGLINYYKKQDNLKEQLFYIERLLKVDTVLNNQYKNLSNTFFKDYDTPKLLEEQKAIISVLDEQKSSYKKIATLLFIIAAFLISLLYYFSLKKKNNEQKFNKIIEELKKKEIVKNDKEKSIANTKKIDISEDAIKSILKSLEIFEKNEGFLKPKITLYSFAAKINTNRKYLSRVVNEYKSKSFNNYINDLRIRYTINRLEKDPVFKKYTIKAIAEEVGFSTTEAFTVAFKKNTGLAASFYIRKLNS